MAWRLMEFSYAEFNAYQREYAAETENVWYLDINDFFYERTEDIGTFQGFRDVFREDGIHLLPDAYVEFAEYLTRRLEAIL